MKGRPTTDDDTAFLLRVRAVLDRRDERMRLAKKREWQRAYNRTERGREVQRRYRLTHPSHRPANPHSTRSPEAQAAREKERQLRALSPPGFLHVAPVLDDEGLGDWLVSRSGPLPLEPRRQPPVEEVRKRQLLAWERAKASETDW